MSIAVVAVLVTVASAASGQTPDSFRTIEFERNWGLGVIGAEYAYARGYSGAGIRLGIADDPIQITHPEFAGRIYYSGVQQAFPVLGFPIPTHGTHVAGLAAAARDGRGMMGVAYEADLAVVQSYPSPGYDWPVDWVSQLIEADVSVMNGSFGPSPLPAQFIDRLPNPTYSLVDFQIYPVGHIQQMIYDIERLAAADVVMVFAAGNAFEQQPRTATVPAGHSISPLLSPSLFMADQPRCNTNLEGSSVMFCLIEENSPTFNANDSATWNDAILSIDQIPVIDGTHLVGDLLVVVATDRDNQISTFSNRCGPTADWCIAAPGVDLASAFPIDMYLSDSGTSMAAPLVAGSAALLRQAFPYMSARQVIELILTNADGSIGDPTIVGHGLMDLASAIGGPIEFGKPSLIPGNDSIFPLIFSVDTQGYDSVWSNDIRGVGGFSKAGDGILTLSGQNTYTGQTTVSGGILNVTGSIAQSNLTVTTDGTLSGTGTVGDTIVMGTLSPGNSVGTLTVDGNLWLADGSIFVFDIDAQQNTDHVIVKQEVTIAPGAQFELVVEDFVLLDQPYQILSAAKVRGTFEKVTSPYTFIDLNFVALDTSLSMVIERNAVPMQAFAQNNNQRAVAQAIDAQGVGSQPHDLVLLNQDASLLAPWYQDWSGEIYATNQTVVIQTTRLVSERLGWRMQDQSSALGAMRQAGAPATQAGATPWADVYGNWQRLGSSAQAADARGDSANVLFGVDQSLGQSYRVGGAFGISQIQTEVVNSRASTMAQHLALYGAATWHALELSGGAIQSWYQTQVSRSLQSLPDGHNRSAVGNVNGHSRLLFAQLALPLTLNQTVRLTPFIELNQTWLRFGGFGESSGSAPLSGQASRAEAGLATLGARAEFGWQARSLRGQVRAMVGWQRGWGDLSPSTTLSFASGPSFTVSSAPMARDSLALSLGVGVQMSDTSSVSLVYAGAFGGGNRSQSLQAQLQWRF